VSVATAPETATGVDGTLARAVASLRAQQDDAGWWKGELETNVTMEAEDLLLRHVLGILSDDVARPTAHWIRSRQREDGTWATFHGGPPDLSTTVEAYLALRLAGDPSDAPHMVGARAFVVDHGGVAATRVFSRVWLALVGEWPWGALPALPPEVVLLGPRVPLNIYDFACWARQTIVPLTVVAAHRLVRPLPFPVHELRAGPGAAPVPVPGGAGAHPRMWAAVDRLLRAYEQVAARRAPTAWLRRAALRRAETWILRRQEADGSWGGIQPPWVYSLLALHALGYPLDHPAVRAGLDGLDRFTVQDGAGRRLEACQSPVWDTALAATALADAGLAPDDPALVRAAEWLLGEEIGVRGDWTVRRPGLEPGGWAFEFANDNYPDVDDTAEVVLALERVAVTDVAARDRAVERGVRWTLGMQCRDGGWGAFDVDNDRDLCTELPFCDFGAVIDPPSADVTAHVVEMLASRNGPALRAVTRAVAWLRAEQEPDGSWVGRWGANHVYGTGAVVPALVAAGVDPADPAVTRAMEWLEQHQNADGGWGEDLRSYRDPVWIGRGESTASQTAWALLALLAGSRRDDGCTRRGVDWLVATQRADGTWDEPQFTGTGFPGDFYINYHLYRQVFPIMALGRYRDAAT
jgi:squalene-hopene/tetraprenyl-beta-curcumene cyclase